MAEASRDLPVKTGAPPKFKLKQLELDEMHSVDMFPFIIFYSYHFAMFLFYFLLIFLIQLMPFHLKWFIQPSVTVPLHVLEAFVHANLA